MASQDIIARFAIKPTSSVSVAQSTINAQGENVEIATKGRHDPCVGIRAVPVGEAMVALVLADAFMEKFGGDSIPETKRNFEGYLKTVGPRKVYQ